MTDRDTFAAAALTGILARGAWVSSECAAEAYLHADAMLRKRDKHPAPPCVETDGFSSDSRTGINRTPERESPRRECEESSLRDVPQLDNSRAAGGPEHNILEHQQPTLTDEEREAVEWFAEVSKPLARLTKSNRREQYISTLRGLLERMK